MEPHHEATPATIMYNILTRKLLPRVQIVVSSREFSVSLLHASARPRNIVALTGFDRKDAEKLFIALIGVNGSKAWKKLKTVSRGLLHFISIPVFLVLTAIVMSRDFSIPPPDTITGLFSRIMQILPSTENIQERDRIIEIINKLKKMAHEGMIEGRVVFHELDLKKYDLAMEDVRDLMIKVPGKNTLSRYLFESHHFILFFFHQSFQEFLSACFVSEMNIFGFFKFNRESLHEDRWSVVRKFTSGLIYAESLSLNCDLHPSKSGLLQSF